MRFFLFAAYLVLSAFVCSFQVNSQPVQQIVSDIFTLEISFGADEAALPPEYLLTIPHEVFVNDKGDIYVIDSYDEMAVFEYKIIDMEE